MFKAIRLFNRTVDIKNKKVIVSLLSEWYAKHWCALLLSPNSTFAQCHSAVDPQLYYKVQQNHFVLFDCLSLNYILIEL